MQRRKSCHGGGVDGCSFIDDSVGYTGCIVEQLHPVTEVVKFPLAEGHTFLDKDTLLVQNGEEAQAW